MVDNNLHLSFSKTLQSMPDLTRAVDFNAEANSAMNTTTNNRSLKLKASSTLENIEFYSNGIISWRMIADLLHMSRPSPSLSFSPSLIASSADDSLVHIRYSLIASRAYHLLI